MEQSRTAQAQVLLKRSKAAVQRRANGRLGTPDDTIIDLTDGSAGYTAGYKTTWNALSEDIDSANYFVSCLDDEDDVRANGTHTATFLKSVLQIQPDHKVLEIGCGVARVGRELAAHCGQWHGSDIAGNMIAHARQRTADLPNVFLHELPTNDLQIFDDNSFDAVYSTIVFMHIDKYDMFKYMREANRVVKPGGRVYFDTYNLLAPEAWDIFENLVNQFDGGVRPRHISQFSTPQEFQRFMEKAGFVDIQVVDANPQLVTALAVCP